MNNQKSQQAEQYIKQTKSCRMATMSLVYGILGIVSPVFLFLCFHIPPLLFLFLFLIPAVICGHIALRRIKRFSTAMTGRGIAIAGLVIGYIGILFVMLSVGQVLLRSRECARRSSCLSNLKQIGLACHMYALNNNEIFPDKLSCLYPKYVSNLKVFICPSTNNKISFIDEIDENTSYIYVSGLTKNDADDKTLACDKPANHNKKGGHGNGGHVLFLDGHVGWELTR